MINKRYHFGYLFYSSHKYFSCLSLLYFHTFHKTTMLEVKEVYELAIHIDILWTNEKHLFWKGFQDEIWKWKITIGITPKMNFEIVQAFHMEKCSRQYSTTYASNFSSEVHLNICIGAPKIHCWSVENVGFACKQQILWGKWENEKRYFSSNLTSIIVGQAH